jgi:hypothetical protein
MRSARRDTAALTATTAKGAAVGSGVLLARDHRRAVGLGRSTEDSQLQSRDRPDFWVAFLDEYHDPSAGPFHMLDPEHEEEFKEKLEKQPARMAGRFSRSTPDTAIFETLVARDTYGTR